MKRKIKISKIILLSIIALILAIITISVFTAVSEVKKFMNQNGFEQSRNENKTDKGETITLKKFSTIVLSGKGKISIEQSDKNNFQYFSDKQNFPEIKNDTLFLTSDDNNDYINVVNLKTIILNKNIKAEISDLKTDTLNVKTNDNSEIKIAGINLQVLNIFSKANSSIELYDIKGENIETKLLLKDNSKIYIDNSKNLNLNIQKNGNAKLEIGS